MSETINEINKIAVNSTLRVEDVNMTNLLFSDGLLRSKNEYTIVDSLLFLKNQPQLTLDLFQFVDNSQYYEFLVNLTKPNTKIHGMDRYGNFLSNLSATVLIFVNGYKLSPYEYTIDEDTNTVVITSQFIEKQISNVIIYTSFDSVYEGNVEDNFSWNPDTNEFVLQDYTTSRYIFFKNGELLPSNKVQKVGENIRLNTPIKHGVDFVEYYRMSQDCYALSFTPSLGYLTYGPEDDKGTVIQNPYNCIITFDEIVRYVIDDIRTGFFVYEKNTDGCVMIVDDDFENRSVKCLIIRKFHKQLLESSEYFITVPDAPSILKYVSQYDLNGVLFKELLASFQKVLLNETYDSIQRIKNVRNINNVDSANISALINFLGMQINITNLNLEQKHNLLEELRTFYNIVGTKASYGFYNIFNHDGKIVDIKQLFTPKKSKQMGERKVERYVDFKTAEELGAILKQKYVTDITDFGQVSELAIDGINLNNTPKFDGVLRYTSYPAILQGIIDRYHSNEDEIYLSADQINLSMKIESNIHTESVFENANYEYDIDANSGQIILEKYIGNDSYVVVPSSVTYEQKTIGEISVTPTNLSIILLDSSNKQVPLYKYEPITNSYKYVIKTTQKYTYKILDEKNNVLFSHKLEKEGIIDSGIDFINKTQCSSWIKVKENGEEKEYRVTLFNNIESPEERIKFVDRPSYVRLPKLVSEPYYTGEFRTDGDFIIKKYNVEVVLGIESARSKFILQFERATLDSLHLDMPYAMYDNILDGGFNTNDLPQQIIDGVTYNVKQYNQDFACTFLGYGWEKIATVIFMSHANNSNPDDVQPEDVGVNNGESFSDVDLFNWQETIYVSLPMINDYITNLQLGPNQPTIDCGYVSDNNPIDFYDFGSVTDKLDGQWISWYEWDRDKNWYPTNHVDISLEIPSNVDYKDFINLFKDTFYEIASTVLYIHQITQVYTFNNLNNEGTTNQPISLLTAQPYRTEEQCFTNDYNFLPYKKATSNPPLKPIKSEFYFSNPTYQLENDYLKVTLELHKKFYTDDYFSEITGNNNIIECVETVTGKLPCRQLNCTTWTSQQDNTSQVTASIHSNNIQYMPKITITRVPNQNWSNWQYAIVINKLDKEEGYLVSQNLQTVTLVAESNEIRKAEAVIDNIICQERPNSIIYDNGQWNFAYATTDKPFKVFKWKAVTITDQNQNESINVGITQFSFDLANDIGWTDDEVVVPSRVEVNGTKLFAYLSTDNIFYNKINHEFSTEEIEYVEDYSYTQNQATWSCKLKQYCVYNTVTLNNSTVKKNYATVLLPTNIKYEDKFNNLSYTFPENKPIYSFDNMGVRFELMPSTYSSQYNVYKYINSFAAQINDSNYIFESYGSIITEGSVVIEDVDYVVIRYKWQSPGQDLDTHTRITNSSSEQINNYAVGWYANSNSHVPEDITDINTNLLNWSGDNTGSGQESVLFNASNINKYYSSSLPNLVNIELRCGWYGNVGDEVYIQIDAYKNGIMTIDPNNPYRYINEGGELKYSTEERLLNVNNTSVYTSQIGGIPPINCPVHAVATLEYDQTTQNVTLTIIPKQNS